MIAHGTVRSQVSDYTQPPHYTVRLQRRCRSINAKYSMLRTVILEKIVIVMILIIIIIITIIIIIVIITLLTCLSSFVLYSLENLIRDTYLKILFNT